MHSALVTAPSVEPVTTAELKVYLRVDIADDDTILLEHQETARVIVEERTGRALITQTWRQILSAWPSADTIELCRSPAQSATEGFPSVLYYSTDDTENTLSSDDYSLDTDAEPGRIVLDYSEIWPTTILRPNVPIKITFKAGYGDAATDVPEPLRRAIMMQSSLLYFGPNEVIRMAFDQILAYYTIRC